MKKLSLIFTLLFISKLAFAQDITQGTWYNDEKSGKIQFFKQGDKIFGKIVWLQDPTENGKPRTDKQNPDEKLRSRPIIGLVNLKNFKQTGKGTWEDGEVYDPKNGKTYSCKLTLASPTRLDVRGFIGISIIGRTSHFTKAD
ncbi:DUF2147 domain-containing protein [Emticicia sp. 21SJ11W-3]|uniref:DUF2147 domain-containing protein n=1 Tax=Emticicia sp. 21SJ11W-3 TaxID=2916755 RepID=UPI00209DD36B|nr:DUF2147 domain-containing protein [Emticicia sp. 21SJ11W-3]UTA70273.1 DUF2147 domain-containing protein [Emticicia sp. 21SJ11W-3]